ncbi:MAG TPA: peptidylprolyl isomerase [Acidimicrobiia bacterium]
MRLLLAFFLVTLAACGAASSEATVPAETTTTTGPAPTTTPAPEDEARRAGEGDTVSVHYRGTLDDGTEFDSSAGRDPLQFVVGSGQVISGFDDAVRGLGVGESVTVRIPPEEAYGLRSEEAIIEVPADQAPEGLQVGEQVQLATGGRATVLEVREDAVVIDANHPLAGEALTFEIELVSIG